MMRITHDKRVNCAYIYVVNEIKSGESKASTPEMLGRFIFDFDEDGYLLGIEVLDAKRFLREEVLAIAEDNTDYEYDARMEAIEKALPPLPSGQTFEEKLDEIFRYRK